MRNLLPLLFCLAAIPAFALDDKYKPSTKTDPIYSAETKAAAAEAERRKVEAAKKANEPLLKANVGKDTSIQTGTVNGSPGVVLKKETK